MQMSICMKCQILFSGKKNKKNIINLSYAEFAKRVLKVKPNAKAAIVLFFQFNMPKAEALHRLLFHTTDIFSFS